MLNLKIIQKCENIILCVDSQKSIYEWEQAKCYIINVNTMQYYDDCIIWCTKKMLNRIDVTKEELLKSVRVWNCRSLEANIINPYNK